MDQEHRIYMQQCMDLAKIALQKGESPVGSLLVHKAQVIGQGIESGKATKDITDHAEILAIRNAIHNGFGHLLKSAYLYTTHEPCIMCSYVIRHHHIPKVIYGTPVDFMGGTTSNFKVLETEEIPKWGTKPKIIRFLP
ncbi:MAG: nucleoside deaminase [Saonia sp.]